MKNLKAIFFRDINFQHNFIEVWRCNQPNNKLSLIPFFKRQQSRRDEYARFSQSIIFIYFVVMFI